MSRRAAWTDYVADRHVQSALFDPPDQPKRRAKGKVRHHKDPLEKDIKRMILRGLRMHPAVSEVEVYGTSAGRIVRADGTQSAWRRWGEPGTPDIAGKLKDGRTFRIEVKRPNSRHTVTPAQQARLAETVAAGGLAGVATSVEEAFAIVEGHGDGC